MATVNKADRTFWHEEATKVLRTMLSGERVSYKDLSRRLERFGEHEPAKTLSNKINRGTFSFQFFLKVMATLGSNHVRFLTTDLSPEDIAAIRREAEGRRRKDFPVKARVRHVKKPTKANRPR